jgi:hypothetical protein
MNPQLESKDSEDDEIQSKNLKKHHFKKKQGRQQVKHKILEKYLQGNSESKKST